MPSAVSTNASLIEAAPLVRVTVDNFNRSETDNYFATFTKQDGFGKLQHARELTPIEHQAVIRLNRDTLYSFGVFDLDSAPVTVTLPDAGTRYMAVQAVDEDHYVPEVFYAPGRRTFTREGIGTRYVALLIRTFVDPASADDMKAAHALQDAIMIEQRTRGEFVVPPLDQESLKKMRNAILALAAASGGIDSSRMFGRREEVDPVQHLLGTATAWGGNPRATALYVGGAPEENDGKAAYLLTVKEVPVDSFWSVSVYNMGGFFEKNETNTYTVNNVTAKSNPDGSVTIHFGGDEQLPNFIHIMPGWNFVFRMYRPKQALLNGAWKLPDLERVK
ncbi:MAG TPA: DUF1254 domain-containing protein [Chthoniobacteraceae bacterium]|jgi:hypothetical protein|nr:DUF1254 domain-containing protein [Chthoniobacteraceae bacterium]